MKMNWYSRLCRWIILSSELIFAERPHCSFFWSNSCIHSGNTAPLHKADCTVMIHPGRDSPGGRRWRLGCGRCVCDRGTAMGSINPAKSAPSTVPAAPPAAAVSATGPGNGSDTSSPMKSARRKQWILHDGPHGSLQRLRLRMAEEGCGHSQVTPRPHSELDWSGAVKSPIWEKCEGGSTEKQSQGYSDNILIPFFDWRVS